MSEIKGEFHNDNEKAVINLTNRNYDLNKIIERLKKENNILKKAIRFYADYKTWRIDKNNPMDRYEIEDIISDKDWVSHKRTGDNYAIGGKTAREALEKIKNER